MSAGYEPEKAQINIHDAEPLYQEIRIENSLRDAGGNEGNSTPKKK
jgi:hypothetical protein